MFQENEKESESFQFMQEKIKERPINKKKLLRRMIITAAVALVFGLVACFTFFWMEPIISNWLYPEKQPEVVSFPEEKEETLPEDIIQTDEEAKQAEQNAQAGQSTDSTITIYEKVGLTLDDYTNLYGELSDIALEAQRSMVNVTGVTSDVNWINDIYENKAQTSGVIVADNGVELLILANEKMIGKQQKLLITFHDGTVIEAEKKQVDANTGFCILSVNLDLIPEETMTDLTIATLGSSGVSTLTAEPVIAIGSHAGTGGSISYGMITSNSMLLKMKDVNYKLLTTDIYGSTNATGILINLKGQVLGIIDNSYNEKGLENQVSAIGITELKRTIELLSNEKERACLGIYGTDITVALSESLNMPRGVYVESFEMGSPAMICGIQASDIITGIDDSVVNYMADLTSTLSRYEPGDVVTVMLQRAVPDGYREMQVDVTLGTLE